MNRLFVFSLAAILILLALSCSQSDRQRLDSALSGDCTAKVIALDKLLPELEDDALKQEADKALVECRTEIDRERAVKLFEDPEKNLEELLKLQIQLKSVGRAGLLENAYNGFISKLFAEGELARAEKLYELFLKRGLVHATNTSYAKAFINCKYETCYPLSKKAFAKMLTDKDYPQVREQIYHVWLEVVSRYGTAEELEEATFVVPCLFDQLRQPLMQVSMEYQLKAADMRRNAGLPERKVGTLDCEAFRARQAQIIAGGNPEPAPAKAEEETKKAE